jgi:alkylated DNA repair dioxygenase AlkB
MTTPSTTPSLPGFALATQRIQLSPHSWLDHTACWLPGSAAALTDLLAELPWTQEQLSMYGRRVNQPRLTAVCGRSMDPASRYTRRNADEPWTPRAQAIRALVAAAVPSFDPNGLIANHYRDGKDSISWHADDENALGRYPLIASVSLGASRTYAQPAAGPPSPA